jgi:Na+-translocating ferredoxin:NAD+ oxidoreductase RnfD subunit
MDYPFLLIIGPELNVGVILFAFLMITDPITSPRNHNLQWLFGFSIAAVNLILRYEQLYYSQFIALFIVLSFTSVFLKHRDSIFNAVRSYSRA